MTDFTVNLYLNHSPLDINVPSIQDVIKITANPCHTSPDSIEFLIRHTQKYSCTLKLYTKTDLYNYLQGVFHLLQLDKKPFHSADLIMTCYPSVKFFMADLDKVLPIIRQAVNLFV
jgi:hypothetical protein